MRKLTTVAVLVLAEAGTALAQCPPRCPAPWDDRPPQQREYRRPQFRPPCRDCDYEHLPRTYDIRPRIDRAPAPPFCYDYDFRRKC
jgi:hypothetical protein